MLIIILSTALILLSYLVAYRLAHMASIDYDISKLLRNGFVKEKSFAFNYLYTKQVGITTVEACHMDRRGWFVILWCPERNSMQFRLGHAHKVSQVIRLAQLLRGIE